MEQNREPRNKLKPLWSINIRQRGQQHKTSLDSSERSETCQKQKLGKNPICYSNKKSKVPRNKLNQGGKTPVTQKTTEH